MAERYKIRLRERIQSSPKEGLNQSWSEWQVVGPHGRVMSRHDLRGQAEAALARLQQGA